MSTFGTTTLNPVSTILLALKGIRRHSPDKVLYHLHHGDPTFANDYDYDYLDAFATLCSFASQCQSASAAAQHCEKSNHLFMATSSPAPPALRDQFAAWIDLIRDLQARPSSSEDGDLESFDYNYTASEQSFIVDVYRACHAKLLDDINRDDIGQSLLESVTEIPPVLVKSVEIPTSQLIADLQLLIGMGQKRKNLGTSETFSTDDLLTLHRKAKAVARFKRDISLWRPIYTTLFQNLYSLTHAVDTLIAFATSSDHEAIIQSPWTLILAGVPSAAPKFLASTNPHEVSEIIGKRVYNQLASSEWATLETAPSRLAPTLDVSGSGPGHFTGSGIVHCESALLLYLLNNHLSQAVAPYIGCAHPICYGCLMLVRAYNDAVETNIEAGPRRIDLRELDVAWAYPPGMDPAVHRWLLRGLIQDLQELATQPHYGGVRPIITDPSGLPAWLRD